MYFFPGVLFAMLFLGLAPRLVVTKSDSPMFRMHTSCCSPLASVFLPDYLACDSAPMDCTADHVLVPVPLGLFPKKLARVTIDGEQWVIVPQLRDLSTIDVTHMSTMFATGDVRRLLQRAGDLDQHTTQAKLGGYPRGVSAGVAPRDPCHSVQCTVPRAPFTVPRLPYCHPKMPWILNPQFSCPISWMTILASPTCCGVRYHHLPAASHAVTKVRGALAGRVSRAR